MSFLGLSFLFALPLIALPVVIHLYRGRQRDIVPWGAMQFLTQATTKGRSMQRLEELLLMALRVGALLALILALAQPMLRSSWFGTSLDREVILLLDNSLSMARTIDGTSAFDEAVEAAVERVNSLSAGDYVHVMLAAGRGQWLTAEGVAADVVGKPRLVEMLEGLQPSRGTARLADALQVAVNVESSEQPSAREIVVFTDDQQRSWQLSSEASWQQLGSARSNSALPTRIEIVTCTVGEEELENLAITKLESSRLLCRPDENIELTARVTNFGDDTSAKTSLEWLASGEVFDTSEIRSLAVGEATQLLSRYKHEQREAVDITVRVTAEDQLPIDSEGHVVVEFTDQLPVLVVHDAETDESGRSADELFAAALGYDGDEAQQWHSIYQPAIVTFAELPEYTLQKYRAIAILNLSQLPDGEQERLVDYVRGGGGLWVGLGDLVDREAFNRYWFDDGAGLSPVSLESLVDVRDTNTPTGAIHPPERDHPATLQLANTTQLDIDQVRLTEYWELVHRGEEDQSAWVVLESGDGRPLAVENLVGEGRVLIQAFPVGLQWSNLPQLKSYVVLVHDWLDYLTAPAMARYNLRPGNPITAFLSADADPDSIDVTLPSGKSASASVTESQDSLAVRYSQSQLPGLYHLSFEEGGASKRVPYYVYRETEESKFEPLTEDDRTRLTALAGLVFDGSTPTETAEAATNAEPLPRAEPVWGVLLAALLALLVGEQLFSNWVARQRSGVAIST